MAARNAGARCPECRRKAVRVMAAPNLALMNGARRRAWAINERSRHEPGISHGGHGGGDGGRDASRKVRAGRARQTKLGSLQAAKANARPWMLGH